MTYKGWYAGKSKQTNNAKTILTMFKPKASASEREFLTIIIYIYKIVIRI